MTTVYRSSSITNNVSNKSSLHSSSSSAAVAREFKVNGIIIKMLPHKLQKANYVELRRLRQTKKAKHRVSTTNKQISSSSSANPHTHRAAAKWHTFRNRTGQNTTAQRLHAHTNGMGAHHIRATRSTRTTSAWQCIYIRGSGTGLQSSNQWVIGSMDNQIKSGRNGSDKVQCWYSEVVVVWHAIKAMDSEWTMTMTN